MAGCRKRCSRQNMESRQGEFLAGMSHETGRSSMAFWSGVAEMTAWH
jgi:hypothetical protein